MITIAKKVFDREYSTSYPLEKVYLSECAIPYTFVKVVDGITIWKYEKTEQLGLALAKFWKSKEKQYEKKVDNEVNNY